MLEKQSQLGGALSRLGGDAAVGSQLEELQHGLLSAVVNGQRQGLKIMPFGYSCTHTRSGVAATTSHTVYPLASCISRSAPRDASRFRTVQ